MLRARVEAAGTGPRGDLVKAGLERMWFMADWEDKKRIVELCSYMWPFKKTTNLWTNLANIWKAQGTTGRGDGWTCETSASRGGGRKTQR